MHLAFTLIQALQLLLVVAAAGVSKDCTVWIQLM
jgi:hypothetical protein